MVILKLGQQIVFTYFSHIQIQDPNHLAFPKIYTLYVEL